MAVQRTKGIVPATESSSTSPQPESSKGAFPCGMLEWYDTGSSEVDIIFIHGLTGDRERTWKAKEAEDPWPKALLPSQVANARILTFGYDAYFIRSGMASIECVARHSMSLLNAIADHRERNGGSERPIIFVCHSLGGLVCEDALWKAQNSAERHLAQVLDCTRGIIFLGTPHRGADLAKSAERLIGVAGVFKQTNKALLSVLKQDSEVLDQIQNGFHGMLRRRDEQSRVSGGQPSIEITCFHETQPLPGVGVIVPSHSAKLDRYILRGIHGNHMEMTKFRSEQDPGFLAVAGELRRWINRIIRPEPYQPPNLNPCYAGTHRPSGNEGGRTAPEPQARGIFQGGSCYTGSTTVIGGSNLQGNFIGGAPAFLGTS